MTGGTDAAGVTQRITFPTGAEAVVLRAAPGAGAPTLIDSLGLGRAAGKGTIVVNGSTAALAPEVARRVGDLLRDSIAPLAVEAGLTVMTGATDAGIFAALGAAIDGRTAPVVGVAPLDLVTWPGRDDEGPDPMALTPLEPHHSHFVLVQGEDWGAETQVLVTMAAELSRHGPAVTVLFGGGAVTRAEAEGHLAEGLPLVVIAGSGRLADALAAAAEDPDRYAHAHADSDAALAALATNPLVTVFPQARGPADLTALLRRVLRLEP